MSSRLPYRLALAGGWIDQPFVSMLDPHPPGSMVVVSLEPTHDYWERAGMATGTRKVAEKLWGGSLPEGDAMRLARELYAAENERLAQPSGSQDMLGLLTPGISRLDYDFAFEGGLFPAHVESSSDPDIAAWLEDVIRLVPVAPRPPGYDPLGRKNLTPEGVGKLGETGKSCYDAILRMHAGDLGSCLNDCMECWMELLPDTVGHRTITADLVGILREHQARSAGAMYSGCGGGYLVLVTEHDVPGSLRIRVRTA